MSEQAARDPLRLLTLEEAARRLGVRWTNVRELVETGQLRAVKIGTRYRVPASALREVGQSGVCVPGPVAGGTGRDGATTRPSRPIKWRRPDGVG
jgi:excisionase family DNA binding protein